jgi:hypothetical protein
MPARIRSAAPRDRADRQFRLSPMRRPDVDALLTLVSFTRDRTDAMRNESAAERLLMLTTMRSNNTALAIVNLLDLVSTEQAQMLCRSLFEDMAVVHWLVMQEDPAFLVERFFDSQDAIALAEHDFVTNEMRLPHELRHGWKTLSLGVRRCGRRTAPPRSIRGGAWIETANA